MYSGKNFPESSRLKANVICVKSFVPKLKKSAKFANFPAKRAARGTSIIEPILISNFVPFSESTLSIIASERFLIISSSSLSQTIGIIISGFTGMLFFTHSAAAKAIASTCIS